MTAGSVMLKFLKLENILESVGECYGKGRIWRWILKEARSSFEKDLRRNWMGRSSTSPAATATTWFINCLTLLLDLVFNNCTLFYFADFLILIITRLITVRSKPDYVEIVLLKLTLPLKFSQNRVSNSWDIPNMYKCHQNKCCLDKCHPDSWNLF